ncbi:MAG TPA: glycerol-3-phosphate acyltransferase, partial [Myxococcota bacterium]|nr:glycerol-3-phosphate acyltransferase [Myxococcota bacterium]
MSGVFVPAIVVAYLVGAIPFAQIIARAHGKDLRTIGSGNIGATNLARACGRKWGYVCFALDVLKGLVPTAAARIVAGSLLEDVATTGPAFLALWLAVGVAAILGHVFPVYLKFKGGKGVSTSFGVGLGLWPYFTVGALVALLVWLLCAAIWRYVSL